MRSWGSKPRDAQLAGLIEVGMCFQVLAGNRLRLAETLFPTKVLKHLGLSSSQCSTMVLSEHACVYSRSIQSADFTQHSQEFSSKELKP